MISYVKTVEQLAAQLLQEGKSPEQAVWPAPFNKWWFERFAGWNIEFVYNTLKEKL